MSQPKNHATLERRVNAGSVHYFLSGILVQMMMNWNSSLMKTTGCADAFNSPLARTILRNCSRVTLHPTSERLTVSDGLALNVRGSLGQRPPCSTRTRRSRLVPQSKRFVRVFRQLHLSTVPDGINHRVLRNLVENPRFLKPLQEPALPPEICEQLRPVFCPR